MHNQHEGSVMLETYVVYMRLSPRHYWQVQTKAVVCEGWTDETCRKRCLLLAQRWQTEAWLLGRETAEAVTVKMRVEYLSNTPDNCRALPSDAVVIE